MNDTRLREKNLATVRAFLACTGPERGAARAPLFAPGATQEIAAPIGGDFQYRSTPVGAWLEETSRSFPDWGHYENVIFQTEDPNLFLVKSHGMGKTVVDGQLVPVEHYYINEFRMRDGKIVLFRETPNPSEGENPYRA